MIKVRDTSFEGQRLRAIRYALKYGGHGGIRKFCEAYGFPPKRWGQYESGVEPFKVIDAIRLIESAMEDLTLDWIYRGKVRGLPLGLRAELETALRVAAAADDDDSR